MTDSASVDMSRQLRAWYCDPRRQASGIPSYKKLAERLGINAYRVRKWAALYSPIHRNVPAEYVAVLCELTGIVPTPRDNTEPEPRPENHPATVAPLHNPYVGTCILCGRQDEYRWTAQQYLAEKPRHCTVCRGRMMVDPVPLTRIGSTNRAELWRSA